MFTILVIVIVGSIGVSAFCSLMEASLFAVPLAYAKNLADQGSRTGKLLLKFKRDLGHPISAILILNTISHTIGASVAGAFVAEIYGDQVLIAFSVVFTMAMLYLSEIIPKQIGAIFARQVALLIVGPLNILIKLLYPLIILTDGVSKFFKGKEGVPSISEQEFLSMTEIGTNEGVLDSLEGSVIKNIIGFDRLLVKDVLTPRVVVFRLAEDKTLADIKEEMLSWNYTRVPIHALEDEDKVHSYVVQRDLFRAFLQGQSEDTPIKTLARELTTVNELMRADKVMLEMFEKREAICAVVDEHGAFAGILTLEDLVEELVGREIMDEYDLVSDLRAYAGVLHRKKDKERQ